MSSFQNEQIQDEQQNSCDECKKKYDVASDAQQKSSVNERIIIPLRKDMLGRKSTNQIQTTLKNLELQIQHLKQLNMQKDKMIDDLKKQMDHKMTHFMIYGEINKQADEINRLRNDIGYGINIKYGNKNGIGEQQIRQIFREQSKKVIQLAKNNHRPRHSSQNNFRQKFHSTHDNYSKLRNQLINSTKEKTVVHTDKNVYHDKHKHNGTDVTKQYFQNQIKIKQIFNVKDAKRKIFILQQKVTKYEEEMCWMNNFVISFIRAMQNIAMKKYKQQIVIPEWCLKKKAKTCWRYMKHLFTFLYSQPN